MADDSDMTIGDRISCGHAQHQETGEHAVFIHIHCGEQTIVKSMISPTTARAIAEDLIHFAAAVDAAQEADHAIRRH